MLFLPSQCEVIEFRAGAALRALVMFTLLFGIDWVGGFWSARSSELASAWPVAVTVSVAVAVSGADDPLVR